MPDTPAPDRAPTEPRSQPASLHEVAERFGTARPLVGMVHLRPLPGAPGWQGSIAEVLERAEADTEALLEGGMDGVLVENFGDLPFYPGGVAPVTTASMARVTSHVRSISRGRPIGVNVLRNDPIASIAVATASEADFIRVNVHTGSMFTDQGLIHGRAHETLRERRHLAPELLILADVMVKHAVPPPGADPHQQSRDLRNRGLADVLVVSGPETGAPADPVRLEVVRRAVPDTPVWIGSGMGLDTVRSLMRDAHGAIVGTALHREGRLGLGIDVDRVRRLVDAVRGQEPPLSQGFRRK